MMCFKFAISRWLWTERLDMMMVQPLHLKSISKRPHLKSLELDFKWNSCDLVLTNALGVQIQLGTLEKLNITFNWFTKPPVSN